MTDILFGQSYYLRFDPKLWAAQQPVSYTHLDVYKRQLPGRP